MISLICTTEPSRIDWLPQFVRHYRALGVERFFLSLQIEPDCDPALRRGYRAQFEKTLAALGIDRAFFLEKTFDAFAIRDHHDAIQEAHIAPDDWVVWSDSDEFQLYPASLDRMTREWHAAGIDFVNGFMIDRVASSGLLPRFDPMTDVWEQFPIACSFAMDVGEVLAQKVTIGRGDVFLSTGNHVPATELFRVQMLTPAGEKRAAAFRRELKSLELWSQIHHFKWDAGLIDRLRFRLTPQWKAKCPWWTESDRLLAYFDRNGGRFNLADLKLFDLPKNALLRVSMNDNPPEKQPT